MVQSYYGIPFVSVQILCKFSYTPCVVLAKAGEIFIINFFERENYRLYSYYSTSFSTISLLHIIIGAMPFRKGKEELQLY